MTNDPTVVTAGEKVDPRDLEELLREGAAWVRVNVPPRFAHAVTDVPQIKEWITDLVERAVGGMRGRRPLVRTGSSLLLAGPTGTGKSHQGFGAMRALSAAGIVCKWKSITLAEFFAKLRPRSGVDSDAEFETIAGSAVLMLDDLGACKNSEWTEEQLYKLVNYRYNQLLPTLFTTNVHPTQFSDSFGARVTSRLTELTTLVPLTGPDRRLTMRGASIDLDPDPGDFYQPLPPDPIGQARLQRLISGAFRAIGESDEARAERRAKAGTMKELPGNAS